MDNKLLSWFMFLRFDSISVGKLDPETIEKITNEYNTFSRDEIIKMLNDEFYTVPEEYKI